MTQLYLIRHGEALSAVHHTIGNTELSPLGIKQAERLRDRLAATGEIKADVLIASTFKRARQTAEIIAPALDLPILLDDEVQELRDGAAEGMRINDYIKEFGIVDFEGNPFQRVAPGGEHWGEFVLRMSTALYRITHQYEGKTIVIVCHGGIVDGSFLYFFGINTPQFPRAGFDTHNTSITAWEKKSTPYDRTPRWRLLKYNDVSHLLDLDASVRVPWGDIATKPKVGIDEPTVPLATE